MSRPYVSLPTSCDEALSVTIRATSWQQPGVVQRTTTAPAPLADCEHLTFQPKPTARLSSDRTTTPSGFDFTLEGNSSGLLDPDARAGSQVRNVRVSLPEGLTVNPSVGAGLGICSKAQFAAEGIATPPGAACPNSSTIGHVTVETPLVEGELEGSMFLAAPDDPATGEPGGENPFDALLALYLVARSPERGVIVKVSGRVDPDSTTGRLVATFVDLPQLPYSRFNVHFRDGQRSLLATPSTCSSYMTGLDASSWLGSTEHVDSPFQLTKGIGGGDCPTGITPFAPTSQAGTLNRQAGSYTSFYLQLNRGDGDQEFTSYSSDLPPGLLGKIAGIPYCPESAIAEGEGQVRARRGRTTLLPRGQQNRTHGLRLRARLRPRIRDRQPLPGGPVPRAADLSDRDQLRQHRALRPRCGHGPLGDQARTPPGAGQHRLRRL